MEARACRLSQSSVGVPLHSSVVSLVYVVGGSSVEYALASTVSPKRRRGVSSFLIHRQIESSFVGRRYPSFFLFGNDV